MVDLVIVGGGISGLALAHFAVEAGLKVTLLEKGPSAGGCIQSWRHEDGFWSELGAHTCYNSYSALLELIEARGLLGRLLPRAKVPFRLLVDDEVRSVFGELRLLELLCSAPRLLFAKKAGATVRDYWGGIVGRRNYERVFGPLFAAVPSQPADDFPADMLFKSRGRRQEIYRSFTMQGGLQSITDAIAADPRLELACNAEVVSIERHEGGASVRLADGREWRARTVAVAVPPDAAASLLGSSFPAVAALLSRLQVTAIDSLGVRLRRGATPLPAVAGLIPLNGAFYSAVSRDTVPDPRWRAFTFHGRPQADEQERQAKAARALKVDGAAFHEVTQRRAVLPSPRPGHAAIVRDLDAALAGEPLLLTGNYFGGLAIEDCVLRSRQEMARLQGLT
jgi:protoporphyrinogen/coproporphyrinogen III oxidase